MHTVAGTDCHAEPRKTVHTSSLPSQIKELIHKDGYIVWNDEASLATYYTGYPDVAQRNNVFVAACILGLENRPFRHCLNTTHINGEKGGHNITVDQFQKFYRECNFEAGLDMPVEEEEDDHDIGRDASEEEHEQLREAAGVVN